MITLENKVVEIDYIHQYTISHGRYEKWRKGTLLQTELERFPLRWYGVEEFKLMLEEIGFHHIVISSDYNYGIYQKTQRKQLLLKQWQIKITNNFRLEDEMLKDTKEIEFND